MKTIVLSILVLLLASILALQTQAAKVTANDPQTAEPPLVIDRATAGPVISPLLFSHNLETTRRSVWRGLGAEMLNNRKFAVVAGDLPKHWYTITAGGGTVTSDTTVGYAGTRSVRVNVKTAAQSCGLGQKQAQLAFTQGTKYAFRFWLKSDVQRSFWMKVSDGSMAVGSMQTTVESGDWQLWSGKFTAAATVQGASFEIGSDTPGTYWIGAASVQPADNFHGMRRDVVDRLKELKPGSLRFPGGCYSDFYQWQDGLLPVDQRPPLGPTGVSFLLPNTDDYDTQEIGTDEFMALCREVGCEPAITLRTTGCTAGDAAAWVEYCNGSADTAWGKLRALHGQKDPYRVKTWFIGNEMYLSTRGMNDAKKCAACTAAFATAIRAVDPNARLVGCTTTYILSGIAGAMNWNMTLIKEAGPLLNAASCHDYFDPQELQIAAKESTQHLRPLLLKCRQDIGLPLVLDEWNLMWGRSGTLGMGLYAAGVLNMLCRESAEIGVEQAFFFQPITEGAIKVTPLTATLDPAGKVFAAIGVHQGNRLLPLPPVSANADLDACASVRADGHIILTAINRSATQIICLPIALAHPPVLNATARFLVPASLAFGETAFKEHTEQLAVAEGGVRVTLPQCSLAVIDIIPAAGGAAQLPAHGSSCADQPTINPPAMEQGNLLPNPSFEEGTGNAIPRWKSRAWSGEVDAQWNIDAPGRTGKQCVTIRSEKGADAAWTATVTVKPNTLYRLSGWIKTKDIQGAIGACLNIQNLPHRTPRKTGTHDWTRVSTVFNSGEATALEINCLFGGWGKSTGQAWYDDVALEPVRANEPLTAMVTVGTAAEAKPYSRMIFGGLLEHFDRQVYGGVFDPGSPLSDEGGFRKDAVAALKELKVGVVRWPGGCYVDAYQWRDSVGHDRKAGDDPIWGVKDTHAFGTDEFVKLSGMVGFEPYICNNSNSSIPEIKDWLEYCNQSAGPAAQERAANGNAQARAVRIWGVGNEHGGLAYAQKVRDAAKEMKKTDPTVKVAACDYGGELMFKTAGEYIDYISVHDYWFANYQEFHTPNYLACMMKSQGPENHIAGSARAIENAGYRGRIKIAFDEWNLRSWHHPGFPRHKKPDYENPQDMALVKARQKSDDPALYTMADALFAASFFNACLRHPDEVAMANVAPLVNVSGPLFVHPKGIIRRTHFHAFAMYANELEPLAAKTDVEADALTNGGNSVPVADAAATVDASGTNWAIALVNRHPDMGLACTVQMKDRVLDGTYDAIVLTGDSPDAYNDIEHPNRVVPVKTQLTVAKGVVNLPPHSLTIIKVPLQ
jgi:alpha-L-arabinofuranosidase